MGVDFDYLSFGVPVISSLGLLDRRAYRSDNRIESFWARARHNDVFPVPGGPCKSTILRVSFVRHQSKTSSPVPRYHIEVDFCVGESGGRVDIVEQPFFDLVRVYQTEISVALCAVAHFSHKPSSSGDGSSRTEAAGTLSWSSSSSDMSRCFSSDAIVKLAGNGQPVPGWNGAFTHLLSSLRIPLSGCSTLKCRYVYAAHIR